MFIWGYIAGAASIIVVVLLLAWLGRIEHRDHEKLHPGRGAIGKPSE